MSGMVVSSFPAPPELPIVADGKFSPAIISDDSTWMGTVMTEVLRFRDALGISSRCGSIALNELLMGTLEDLKKKYPMYSSFIQISEVNHECLHQGLLHFNKVLKSIGDSWSQNYKYSSTFGIQETDLQTLSVHQLAENALEMLKYMVLLSQELFDHMEMVSSNAYVVDNLPSKSGPLHTSISVLSEAPNGYLNTDITRFMPVLRSLSFQDVGKLQTFDANHVSVRMYPLILDNSPHLPQKDESDDELKLGFSKAPVKIELNQPALIDKDAHFHDKGRAAESISHLTKTAPGYAIDTPPSTPRPMSYAELLMPSTAHFDQVNLAIAKDNNGNDISPASEATLLSLPILRLGASGLQSPTPTPPASPMVLTGVFMPFSPTGHAQLSKEHPFAHSMALSDFDHGDGREPSESVPAELRPADQMLHRKSPLGRSEFPSLSNISQSKASSSQSQPLSLLHLKPIPEGFVPPSPPPAPPPAPPPPISTLPSSAPWGAMSITRISPPPPPPPPPSPPGTSVQSASPPHPSTPRPSSSVPPPLAQTPRVIAHTEPPPPPLPPKNPRSGISVPPPPPSSKGSTPSAPLPSLPAQGVGPPPPPAMKALRAKVTKLKRSTQMGNLYRLLKRKLEGSSIPGKTSTRQKRQTSTSIGEKGGQGIADALAEMTKRSSYFQHIEEDVEKYSASILELKSGISNFRTNNMAELQNFHKDMEKHLEDLTDETQVLSRFEGFPFKKLESIRMAVGLYMKLDGIFTSLKNWKMAHPVAKQLEKIESYFSKIKEEVDAIERTKDEECKRFQSNNIEFDFGILTRIKEVMVDLSSYCIEMALKESKEANQVEEDPNKHKPKQDPSKLLWRAFQLAFRVYNFAGGQDERADRLTSELAREIETYSRT